MASVTLSALAGSLLSPLREVSLEKLIGFLWDYLSSSPSPSSSSPDEAEKQQQLKDSLEALEDAKLTVRSMQSRIMKLFQKHKQNERVVGLHNKLKDVGYNIQDLESEMEYMQVERKVHEINKAEEEEEADSTSSRFSLKRSFPFGLPSVSLSKKKRRLPTSSQFSSLSTDENIVRQVTSILKQIQIIESKLKGETMLEDLFDQITLNGVYDPREHHHFTQNERVTTSSTNERKIYGRDYEIQRLIEFLTGPNVDNSNVSVVPIVGFGGIGKTTLAQFVFNHEEIDDHFNKKAWICVSDRFDRFRITKQMVDSVCSSTVPCDSTTTLDFLERKLKKHLRRKTFLLVLDDIWSNEWQQLLTPLQSAQAQAQSTKIKIIVTCREPTVLRSIDQGNQMYLGGIDDEEYWSLFLNCTFGENNPANYSHELHDIGKLIVEKLMGSPLAAKTVGKLLECRLTKKHWNDVLENDLWKLKTDAHDIMPALALSYYHLPQHLQQCFVFCSVFPKDHFYLKDELICMWIANGYIHESGSSSKTMNDIGEDYYYELVGKCFFEEEYVDEGSLGTTMHDLMHDLAKLVSHKETYIYESGKDKEISKNVRHLYADCRIDQGLVRETNKLRTLVLKSTKDMSAILNHGAFNRIRVLVMSYANVQEFPNAIPRLKHLQYLDLRGTQIKSIPDSLCELYLLRVLALPHHPQTLPSRFHSLINLELLCMGDTFDNLEYYVNKEMGFMVAQLRNMNELKTRLSIKDLQNIDNREEAMKAKLKEKHHIKSLLLSWYDDTVDDDDDMVDNDYTVDDDDDTVDNDDSVDDDCKHVAEEVLEGLQPHPNLEELFIGGYMGCNMPNWLKTLQNLKRIELFNYSNCLVAALGLLPSLEKLCFRQGENVTIECESCDDSDSDMFPSLRQLSLEKTTVSFTGIPTSSSSSSSPTTPGRRKVFPRLQELTIYGCNEMDGFPWPICIALKWLVINYSPGMDDKLPGCLHGFSSLTQLTLTGAKIKTFDAEVMATLHELWWLDLEDCDELLSLEGLQALSSLQHLYIDSCDKFRSWCSAEMAELRELSIWICQDLESLPTWLHRLSSLKELTIDSCPKLLSLPEGGLPSSLESLYIMNCDPGFLQRCQQEGSPEWLMIQHIPTKEFIENS